MTDPTTINGDVFVSPRYLAGNTGDSGISFDPVRHWPHHYPGDGPCQLVITSPDHRIRLGWFGDDHDLWIVSAARDAVSEARWTATFNQNTPPELVHGLTSALAAEWDAESTSFLDVRSYYWTDAVRPLLDAGWERRPVRRGEIEILAPDGLAGASIDIVNDDPYAEIVRLWAGPPGWGTRAEAAFTGGTPNHLIAAVAAAFVNPSSVARYRSFLRPQLAELAEVSPVKPPVPTPRDVRDVSRRMPALPARNIPRWSTSTAPRPITMPASRPRR